MVEAVKGAVKGAKKGNEAGGVKCAIEEAAKGAAKGAYKGAKEGLQKEYPVSHGSLLVCTPFGHSSHLREFSELNTAVPFFCNLEHGKTWI